MGSVLTTWPKHHVTDILTADTGAFERFAHHLRGQIGGSNIFQTATKRANGGTHGADNNNFAAHEDSFSQVNRIERRSVLPKGFDQLTVGSFP